MSLEPLWIPVPGGRLFGVLHMPEVQARAGVVVCPPFLHEHVRSQRLFAMLADELCKHGFAVLRFDYLGTGDSEGSDESFSMNGAERDAEAVAQVLRDRIGSVPMIALGVRAGAHAACALRHFGRVDRLWLWQPLRNGNAWLASMRERAPREWNSPLRYAQFNPPTAQDEDTVMGFPCSAAFCKELQQAKLSFEGVDASRLTLLDAVQREDDPPSARIIVLPDALSAWADEMDMARVALAPIKAVAASLAETGAVA